jgi:ankyrin repeat protein
MRSFRLVLLPLVLLMFAAANPAAAQNAQSRLWDAAMAGDTAAIRQAVTDGANVDSLDMRTNRNGRRALNWAAWYDRADAVKVLLELKANIEGENITGFTAPLTIATERGHESVAKLIEGAPKKKKQ